MRKMCNICFRILQYKTAAVLTIIGYGNKWWPELHIHAEHTIKPKLLWPQYNRVKRLWFYRTFCNRIHLYTLKHIILYVLLKQICKQNLANSQKYFMKCPLTNSIPEVWCLKNAACLAPMQNLHHNGANFLNWGGARDLISLLWHSVAKNINCLHVLLRIYIVVFSGWQKKNLPSVNGPKKEPKR